MIFRVRFRHTGAHVRCRLYVAPRENCTFAMCGEFTVLDGKEFDSLQAAFAGAEFINDNEQVGTHETTAPATTTVD